MAKKAQLRCHDLCLFLKTLNFNYMYFKTINFSLYLNTSAIHINNMKHFM